jgi:hypothetical protein
MQQGLPWRDSKIIYEALLQTSSPLATAEDDNSSVVVPPALKLDFQKQGVHLKDQDQ